MHNKQRDKEKKILGIIKLGKRIEIKKIFIFVFLRRRRRRRRRRTGKVLFDIKYTIKLNWEKV